MSIFKGIVQDYALPDEDDEAPPEPPPGEDDAQGLADTPGQSPVAQSASSRTGVGLQVQWRWAQQSHPEQGVTCMAWNEVSSPELSPRLFSFLSEYLPPGASARY